MTKATVDRFNEPGFKDDGGKVLMGTLLEFPLALKAVAEVATFGVNKYTRGGWRSVPDGRVRYTDAMMRHLLDGDGVDDGPRGSGLLHEAHFVWNAIARLELRLREATEAGGGISTPFEVPEPLLDTPRPLPAMVGDVLAWPNGDWIWEHDADPDYMAQRSDDYSRIRLPLGMSESEVDIWVRIQFTATGDI